MYINMDKRKGISGCFIALAAMAGCTDEHKSPNVVFILADDLGYGDISCLGQTHFQTPNIDALASQGVLFTQHYSGAPVSAPSRSVLLTGLHSGHTPVRGNREMKGEGQQPLPGEAYTIFDMFKSAGYVTGVYGKWGLGYPGSEGTPSRHGVDSFYGYNCQRYAHSYYPDHLWHNDTKIELDGNRNMASVDYAPALIHEEALKFIDENQDKPFMMIYASVLPHAELIVPEEDIKPFSGKFGEEVPYHGLDSGEYFRKGGYCSQPEPHAAFAAMVTMLDRQVGEIMTKLEEKGIADNTIIVFTSDNGPHVEGGADPDYFGSAAGMRGYKRDLYDGGIRVPMIVRWPGTVSAGAQSDHVSAFWDFMPTFAEIIGAKVPEESDGISFLPQLTGRGEQKEHEYLYWEFHEDGCRQAVRKGDWKGIAYDLEHGRNVRLYNVKADPAEKHDLASEYPEMAAEMDSLMRASHHRAENFPFPGDEPAE